ncbi:MAG TPA: hypothetical protein VHT91_35815 [Kofleriaceae bacterium]|nr:hypothetical protein [Kofleriaceae bacterium]
MTGYNWHSNLTLSELSGEVDLAVRVHFLFFKHTFKQKLFSWPALATQNLVLIGGGTGDTLAFSGDYGQQADDVAYTSPVPAITDNPPNLQLGGPDFACQPVVVVK